MKAPFPCSFHPLFIALFILDVGVSFPFLSHPFLSPCSVYASVSPSLPFPFIFPSLPFSFPFRFYPCVLCMCQLSYSSLSVFIPVFYVCVYVILSSFPFPFPLLFPFYSVALRTPIPFTLSFAAPSSVSVAPSSDGFSMLRFSSYRIVESRW